MTHKWIQDSTITSPVRDNPEFNSGLVEKMPPIIQRAVGTRLYISSLTGRSEGVVMDFLPILRPYGTNNIINNIQK